MNTVLSLFTVFFILLVSYCLFFAFFNYIYVLVFLDLLILGLILMFLIFAVVLENNLLQNFALILLGIGASETAVGLLLFIGTFKLQVGNFFVN
jgi:NADH:ubiquinone oxidoreductase subunit K